MPREAAADLGPQRLSLSGLLQRRAVRHAAWRFLTTVLSTQTQLRLRRLERHPSSLTWMQALRSMQTTQENSSGSTLTAMAPVPGKLLMERDACGSILTTRGAALVYGQQTLLSHTPELWVLFRRYYVRACRSASATCESMDLCQETENVGMIKRWNIACGKQYLGGAGVIPTFSNFNVFCFFVS
eukprot:33347-Amphidinium_carterae.3